jgi:hypothetical protein
MDSNYINQHNEANIKATVLNFLKADGWFPQELESNLFRVTYAGKNGKFVCFAQLRFDKSQLLFYVMSPINCPMLKSPNLAEYLTRANWGLRIGNFEMDYSDGQIRYKTSIDYDGFELNDHMIRNLLYPAIQTADRYLPGIMHVIFGNKTPEEAIIEIEGTSTST